MQFERLKLLIGNEGYEKIKEKTVLVLGLGGVGSYAVEALVRSGIGKLIIVDKDIVDITNLNRQLMALYTNIGLNKVDVWEERIKNINPQCEVIKIKEYINEDNINILFNYKFDYLIDACDSISAKKAVIRECSRRKIKFISSMGAGNKLDPTKFQIMDIRKTSYDPLARVLRKMVYDEKINNKVMVVCSTEKPRKNNTGIIGSIAFVPAVSGLLCASYIINDILGDNYEN